MSDEDEFLSQGISSNDIIENYLKTQTNVKAKKNKERILKSKK